LFNLDQAKKEILAKYPQIQDVKIERKFPSKIYALIEERQGVAVYVDAKGSKFSVDTEGYAFDPADSTESVIEILDPGTTEAKIGSPVILKDTLAAILKMKGEIDSMGKISVVQARLATPERINLLTSEGWYIYFNPLKDINEQLVKLNAVLSDASFAAKRTNLEYLDIRFTRVYLKERVRPKSWTGKRKRKRRLRKIRNPRPRRRTQANGNKFSFGDNKKAREAFCRVYQKQTLE